MSQATRIAASSFANRDDLTMGIFQSNIFQNNVFQGPHEASTASTFAVDGAGGPGVVVFWPKKKFYELKDELEQERQADAKLTPLQRAERDLARSEAELEAALSTAGDNFNAQSYGAIADAQHRIADLQKQLKALRREQQIKDLADQIKQRRQAFLDSLRVS
jgi:hypothetical protein